MLNKVLWLLLLVHTNSHICLSTDLPKVETPVGKILGVQRTSNGGRKYAAFEGIPFAKPPVGELRFEAPEPIEPWSEVLNATEPRTCPQLTLNTNQVEGEEDCLHLNVYVPGGEIDPQRNFDVLVNIHGGGFFMGSGRMMEYASTVMDRDFVLVSVNYRLGILGFLSTEDAAIPGNNGMKDQVLALRWVRDNIASFGGNPDSVTISGQSAGAVSVQLHYFSPMSKGLFVRGMSQSGTALDPFSIKRNPLENAKKLAALLECPDTSTSELKQCLKTKPATLFLEKLKDFDIEGVTLRIQFAPVVEKDSANPFLVKDPYLMLEAGEVLDVPWIISTTAEEGLLSTGALYTQLETVDSNWSKLAHFHLIYENSLPASEREEVARKIKDFYLGPGEHINKDNFYKFTKIFTDRWFATGGELAAKIQSRVNKSPVYYYLFNYRDGENNVAQYYTKNKEVKGVAHGEDALYFYMGPSMKSESDIALTSACQDMLYSYVKTGEPSFDGTDNWLPTTDSELVYLNITGPGNMKLQRIKDLTPIEFWRSLGLFKFE